MSALLRAHIASFGGSAVWSPASWWSMPLHAYASLWTLQNLYNVLRFRSALSWTQLWLAGLHRTAPSSGGGQIGVPDRPAARMQRRGPARGTSSPAPAQHNMLGDKHGAQGFEMIQGFQGHAMMSDHESMMHAASTGGLPGSLAGPFQQQRAPGVSALSLEEQQRGTGTGLRKPMQPMASPFGTSQVQQVGLWQGPQDI